MNRTTIAVIGLIATICILLFLLLTHEKNPAHPLLGQSAPLATFTDIEQDRTNKSYIGPKLIYFGATWCPSCQVSTPYLRDLPIPLYMILYRDTIPLTDDLKGLAELIVRDPHLKTSIEWGVSGIPSFFLLDQDNVVRWIHKGKMTNAILTDQLLPMIQKLQAETP